MNLKKTIEKLHTPNWLTALLAFIFILRIPSFFEPYAYGDEMIYLTLGNAVRQGVTLYSGIHDNKPPLLYLTAAAAGNLFWFKAILAFWMLGTTILFWHLTKTLFSKNKNIQIVSTCIFGVLTTIPLFEGNIANAELFMIGFSITAFLLMFTKKHTVKNMLITGVLFGMASLYKIPAAFEVPALFSYWFIVEVVGGKLSLPEFIKKVIVVSLGFAGVIAISLVWYAARGALSEYVIAAFGQNVGYLSSFRPGDVAKPFFVRNGPLLMRFGVVVAGLGILLALRKKLSKQFIFLTVWLLFALFATTLSERPYPHYLVQALPATSILFGMLIASTKIEQVYTLVTLMLFAAVPVVYKFWFYSSAPYYKNFISFATGQISKKQYYANFNVDTNMKYEVSKYLVGTAEKHDSLYVWGDTATIYALTRQLPPIKYVADYHLNDFSSKEELMGALVANPPRHIVILPQNTAPFSELTSFLNHNYFLANTIENAQIWARISER